LPQDGIDLQNYLLEQTMAKRWTSGLSVVWWENFLMEILCFLEKARST